MSWEFVPAQDHFEAAREEWDNLNRLQGDHILLDSEFTSALLRHFGSNTVRLGILQSLNYCGRSRGMPFNLRCSSRTRISPPFH